MTSWEIKFVKLRDLSRHYERTTPERPICQKLSLWGKLFWDNWWLHINSSKFDSVHNIGNRVKFRRICVESSEKNGTSISETICPTMLVIDKYYKCSINPPGGSFISSPFEGGRHDRYGGLSVHTKFSSRDSLNNSNWLIVSLVDKGKREKVGASVLFLFPFPIDSLALFLFSLSEHSYGTKKPLRRRKPCKVKNKHLSLIQIIQRSRSQLQIILFHV